jgi:NAD(P)-dependent dehydrogenase (short-subunit alcohol dehydrogenase family)
MKERLKYKVVAVTGGNSGIGLASAKEFAAQGAKVAILARTQEKIDKAVAEIGNGAVGFVGDVANLPSIGAFYEGVKEKLGKIDVVFANAGIANRGFIEEVDEAAFDLMVNVNFKGVFFTVKYVLPHLNEGASIILTSSCLDEMGMAGLSAYSATKAAIEAYHEFVGGKLPAGRMGKSEEMASVALFLASEDSSFMYGAEIQADGGMNQTRWFD